MIFENFIVSKVVSKIYMEIMYPFDILSFLSK